MLDLNTVFPLLVNELTNSKLVFGLLYSIMLGVPLIFNIIFSHYLKRLKKKKRILLFGIYLRSFSFFGMAIFTVQFAVNKPVLTTASFFLWVFLFSISAGFAGISYADIIGKTMTPLKRNQFFATKQLLASIVALAGGLLIQRIFSMPSVHYPYQYGISLFIGGFGLAIASLGILTIKEPDSAIPVENNEKFSSYIKRIPSILKQDKPFSNFILVENLASFSIMVLPFYIIFAKKVFDFDESFIGIFLIAQTLGTVLSNIIWGLLAVKKQAKCVVSICILIGGLLPLLAIILSFTSVELYIIVFVLIGFVVSGRRVGFEPYLLDIAPEDKRTEYLGIRGTMNLLVVILPIVGGLFIDLIGYYATFSIVSFFMIFAYFLLRKSK